MSRSDLAAVEPDELVHTRMPNRASSDDPTCPGEAGTEHQVLARAERSSSPAPRCPASLTRGVYWNIFQ